MPATILPFVRPDPASRGPDHHSDAEPTTAPPALRPSPAPALRPTSRQIAHRWAMLSHLARHYPRPQPRDTVR